MVRLYPLLINVGEVGSNDLHGPGGLKQRWLPNHKHYYNKNYNERQSWLWFVLYRQL